MEYSRSIILKDGRECLLRHGVPEDARQVLDCFLLTHGETDYLSSYPDECRLTVEKETEYLRSRQESPDELMLLAEVNGRVVGTAGVDRISRSEKMRHRANFGISVERAFWGLGIGREMLRACVDCAGKAGYTQLELEVVGGNERAMTLYESEGFVIFGRNPKGFRTGSPAGRSWCSCDWNWTSGQGSDPISGRGPMKRIKKVTIVSLSRGILGESYIKHELDIGIRRLTDIGLEVRFSEHCLSGLEYIDRHPEARAADLLEAFRSDTDMILCAIGGDDTYRLLPYLFEHDELRQAVSDKVFLGFSDSTVNHFMLHKVGLNTFYGQAFLSDVCELAPEMLPYTGAYFEELITTGTVRKITPSGVWYEPRCDFGPEAVGTALPEHRNGGFELLQGAPVFGGPVLGGCIDTMYDMLANGEYPESIALCRRYGIFPPLKDWAGKILLLESSEVQAPPEKYRLMVRALKQTGVFEVINGVLVGKPYGEKYHAEYKKILAEEIARPALPVAANINVGHALPRCIIPLGVDAVVDMHEQQITFLTNE